MEIKRDYYLQQLIDRKHNGLIKIVTGIRHLKSILYAIKEVAGIMCSQRSAWIVMKSLNKNKLRF